MLEIGPGQGGLDFVEKRAIAPGGTYDRTFENSLEGDMTKLSFVLAQEMRCWMLWSSSMLLAG